MSTRNSRPEPEIFPAFPEYGECPICGTNDDGKVVMVPIAGAPKDSYSGVKYIHLACAIIQQWDESMEMGFSGSVRHKVIPETPK